MKNILYFLLLSASLILSAAEDQRPAFDKSGHRGTLWTQVNPWFPVNRSRTFNPLGGPNYARKVYPGVNDNYNWEAWKQAIQETQKYGMTGWQFELVASAPGFANVLKTVLKAAEELNSGFKISIMLGLYGGKTYADKKKMLFRQFRMFEKEWKNHPSIYRLNGTPVINVYTPHVMKPEEWKTVIADFEKEFGKAIWLLNYKGLCNPGKGEKTSRERLHSYIPHFDGVTAYGNWTLSGQTRVYEIMADIMKDYPQKIFEGCIHNAYSCHYYHGGVRTRLSEKVRKCWDSAAAAKVDSIVMTNFFDVWENSLIFPCYERGDFMLRYAQYQMHKIFGNPFPMSNRPELILTSYIDLIPGSKPIDFEIVSLPVKTPDKTMELGLDVCDSSGKVIHSFPAKKVRLDQLTVLTFTLPEDVDIYNLRAVVPRIRGTRNGKPWLGDFNPPTILDPSIQTSMMFWAHSTISSLHAAKADWSMNGIGPGGTLDWNSTRGQIFLRSELKIPQGKPNAVRLMRNGNELFRIPRSKTEFSYALELPNPGKTLNYYWLEAENQNGERFRTLPIWVTANTRPGKTVMQFKRGKTCLELPIETARIPVLEYPCDMDTGYLLWDISGYCQQGKLQRNGKVGYCFGSLGYTSYYHYHNGFIGPAKSPLFRKDEQGKGYLNFDSSKKDFYMISGGCAMPYSGTYEMEFRPEPNGQDMFLIGTANNQINVWLDKNGILHASRKKSFESFGGEKAAPAGTFHLKSKSPVEPKQWHTLKVCYDMKEMRLFLDGKLQAKVQFDSLPKIDYESINHLTLGSRCGFLHTPGKFFNGGIRNLIITGCAKP